MLSVDISSMCGQFFQQAGNSTKWKFYFFFFHFLFWKKILQDGGKYLRVWCEIIWKKLSAHWCDDNTFVCVFCCLWYSQLLTYFLILIPILILILSQPQPQLLTYFSHTQTNFLILNTFSTSTSDILSHTNPISILSHFFMLRQHRNIVRSKKT